VKTIAASGLESAPEEEMREHLGYDNHRPPAGGAEGNVIDGTLAKTVLTEAAGELPVPVPRDRAGKFEPVVVRKRQRRLSDVDAVATSLYAKGLTTGEMSAHC
jgi:transposase-like protein